METNQAHKPVDRSLNFKNLKKIRDRGYESGADKNGKIHTYDPNQIDQRLCEMAAMKVIQDKIRLFSELMINDPWFSSQPTEIAKLRFALTQLEVIKHDIKEACK